ncbi:MULTISPECIES: homoserine dehydrogenase [Pseudomonas]|uniref:homoserine dehydrogenase n=1 Tax=Pseudomonas wuhanensis TaxID=2954098 RepID=A0ABY9GYV5_9PSED|nr:MULTISPECIES: homoserine dehydrogenase [unclassified Pseudomonas]WLI14769.1 homoserine dehydrogenase [Pseudomonas sp. FP603]WLI20692.1 homoserine dehydrogenase [Pseudomonas sp. FP607]
MTEYKIALVGFGGVNRGLAQLVADRNAEWKASLGFGIKIVGVTDLFLGSIVAEEGLDAKQLVALPIEKGALAQMSGGTAEALNEAVIKHSGADMIAEATFTNPVDGEPATTFCRWALESGIHVVTTNKGPIALHGAELKDLARRKGVAFEYEGSVMSGTPVIRLARQALAGVEVQGFEGILNGTSNYVLTRMKDGLAFNDAVAQAQQLGYAEADPTADVEGFDVRLKVVILANELLNARLSVSDVACSGISRISPEDIAQASANGASWKLIGSANREVDGSVRASVEARLLPNSHPLAGISGATNAVSFKTTLLGAVTVSGPGAGRIETAFALLSDIIAIHTTHGK